MKLIIARTVLGRRRRRESTAAIAVRAQRIERQCRDRRLVRVGHAAAEIAGSWARRPDRPREDARVARQVGTIDDAAGSGCSLPSRTDRRNASSSVTGASAELRAMAVIGPARTGRRNLPRAAPGSARRTEIRRRWTVTRALAGVVRWRSRRGDRGTSSA
jgi:hypothetical protein